MTLRWAALCDVGYYVGGCDPAEIAALADAIVSNGYSMLRDVTIGSDCSSADLIAEPGDLWFHTDGCFLDTPPRWVVQVLAADGGGAVTLLDADLFWHLIPAGTAMFGGAAGVTSAIRRSASPRALFRYRRDYMAPDEVTAEQLKQFDEIVASAASCAFPLK